MGWSWVGETVVSPSVRPSGMRLIATSNLHCAIRPLCMLPASEIELGGTDASSVPSHASLLFYLDWSRARREIAAAPKSERSRGHSFLPSFLLSLSLCPLLLPSPSLVTRQRRQLRRAERTKERQQSVGRAAQLRPPPPPPPAIWTSTPWPSSSAAAVFLGETIQCD